ncbi:MAG TPA: glycosyltransferase family 1 protein, partial [Arcobacter sp.]|nr:glycosyltransferase family 1 protein [Arcobacter sp.]
GTLFIKESPVTKIAKLLYKVSQSKADRVFFQNRDDFNFFTDKGIVTSTQCDVLPGSGVDTNRFKPQYKEESSKVRFLLIARMIWEKGIGEYVQAAREIQKINPNVEFCLLGFLDVQNPGAITKSEMDEWVEEGVINYLGISDNVDEVIQTADCVVLPSYYREGTPKTLLESGSSGKPIITTDSVGCRDVVDHGINGYICEPRSWEDLKLKIEMFLELDYEARLEMGKRSREKMTREFDEKIVINKYLDLLHN